MKRSHIMQRIKEWICNHHSDDVVESITRTLNETQRSKLLAWLLNDKVSGRQLMWIIHRLISGATLDDAQRSELIACLCSSRVNNEIR